MGGDGRHPPVIQYRRRDHAVPPGLPEEPLPEIDYFGKIEIIKIHSPIVSTQKPGIEPAPDIHHNPFGRVFKKIHDIFIVSFGTTGDLLYKNRVQGTFRKIPFQGIFGTGQNRIEFGGYFDGFWII